MSPEARAGYPCLVDLRRNCDYHCKLMPIARKILKQAAGDKHWSQKKYLASLRSDDPEIIDAANMNWVSKLAKVDQLNSCRLVENGELQPQIPRRK